MRLRLAAFAAIAVVTILTPADSLAQSTPTDVRDEFLGHFERSSYKAMTLAEVIPETLYDWSPGEGVMPIAQVYAHIARYNFMYLDENLGIAAPEDIDYMSLEEITGKGEITEALRRSVEHVKERALAMTEEELVSMTTLYGRRVAGWAVLFQLISHMNEHVGQSVSYARMNGIAPPWSR